MSATPYIGISECAASKKLRRLSDSSSSKIGPSVLQVMLSFVSEVTVVSVANSADMGKSIIFKSYRGPLLMH